MASTMRSSHDIIIRTQQWDDAMAFYGGVLGLAMTCLDETLAYFETGGFRLYVERGTTHGPVFEFLVTDVAATRDRLLASGCELVEEDAAIPRCYVRDPFGMVFNIGHCQDAS